MDTVLKDIRTAISLISSISDSLVKYQESLPEDTDVDVYGLEGVSELVSSARFDLEEALDEIPYIIGEK